ncbi:Hypothetical protein NTJ_12518 [Nesidiocoris tenuis]|uniref:Uncharacterized protein n=1 Tax=Nesidiocoris tenuis TaxID=355587 RepID=A0ABN7B5L5_9HEMI|nr:Hypothetical protein NTJ_12518 [Nesidiocoris tenuis]
MRVLICAVVFYVVSASDDVKDRRIVIDSFADFRDMVNFIRKYPNGNFEHLNDNSVGLNLDYQHPNRTKITLDSNYQTVVARYPKMSLVYTENKDSSFTSTGTRRQDTDAANSTIEKSGTEISQEEILQIIQEIPVPYPVKIEKNVHYPVPVPYDQPVPIHVSQPYPIRIEKKIPVPVAVRVPQPIPIIKNIPVPVEVPVDNPVPYPVYKSVPFYIQKNVPYPVYKEIPMSVEVPEPVKKEIIVPVTVEKKIPLFVPKPVPYEIKVPIPRTIRVESPYKYKSTNITISQANFAQVLKDDEFTSSKSLEFPVEFTNQNGWTPVFSEQKDS